MGILDDQKNQEYFQVWFPEKFHDLHSFFIIIVKVPAEFVDYVTQQVKKIRWKYDLFTPGDEPQNANNPKNRSQKIPVFGNSCQNDQIRNKRAEQKKIEKDLKISVHQKMIAR